MLAAQHTDSLLPEEPVRADGGTQSWSRPCHIARPRGAVFHPIRMSIGVSRSRPRSNPPHVPLLGSSHCSQSRDSGSGSNGSHTGRSSVSPRRRLLGSIWDRTVARHSTVVRPRTRSRALWTWCCSRYCTTVAGSLCWSAQGRSWRVLARAAAVIPRWLQRTSKLVSEFTGQHHSGGRGASFLLGVVGGEGGC